MSAPDYGHRHPLTGEKPEAYWHRPGQPPRPIYRSDPFRKGADPSKLFYTVRDCMRMTGRERKWVVRAIKSGRLKASRPNGPRGNWQILGSDFLAFMAGESDVGALPKPVAVGQRK